MARWHDLLDDHLRARPHRIALCDSTGTCWTSAELDAASNAIAARMLDAGAGPGQRVAVVSGNCGPAVAAMAACSRLQAVAVPIEAGTPPEKLNRILDHCRPSIILFGTAASAEARAHARRMSTRPLGGHWGRMEMARLYVGNPAAEKDLAAIFYGQISLRSPPAETAGLMFSHEGLLFAAVEFAAIAGMTSGDQVAGTVPLSIASGFTSGVMAGLTSGAQVVLKNSFSASGVRAALADGATHLLTSQPLLDEILFPGAGEAARPDAPDLRYVATTAPMRNRHRHRIERALGAVVQTGYVPPQSAGGVSISRRPGSGAETKGTLPYDRTEVRILAEDGRTGTGVEGKILLRGPQIMMGYYRSPALTRRFLDADGWFRTGDTGWLDGQGRLHVNGEA